MSKGQFWAVINMLAAIRLEVANESSTLALLLASGGVAWVLFVEKR